MNTIFLKPQVLRGYIDGLTLSNNGTDATNDIDVAVGAAWDNTAGFLIQLTAAITGKQLDVAWGVGSAAGMLATGVAIANGTYHIFLIRRPDTGVVDIAADSSATGANIAANTNAAYTQKRRIGSILRESAAIVGFVQNGDLFMRKIPVAVSGSPFANQGTSAVDRTLPVPTGIKVLSHTSIGAFDVSATAYTYLYLSDKATTDVASGTSSFQICTPMSTGVVFITGTANVMTDTSGVVRTRISNSDVDVSVYLTSNGWTDQRGKND